MPPICSNETGEFWAENSFLNFLADRADVVATSLPPSRRAGDFSLVESRRMSILRFLAIGIAIVDTNATVSVFCCSRALTSLCGKLLFLFVTGSLSTFAASSFGAQPTAEIEK